MISDATAQQPCIAILPLPIQHNQAIAHTWPGSLGTNPGCKKTRHFLMGNITHNKREWTSTHHCIIKA
jgi:hypothetical protein